MTTKKIVRTKTSELPPALLKMINYLRTYSSTARQIALDLKCSKPTVYARLNALSEKHGFKLKTESVRDGSKGPRAISYSLSR